mmetsp:Transcript_19512/g.60609  ORF Transcript_19512/g.60609 Transcript_19512/m.60609 type:complete len:103 (-) Transcript_19512:7-315(-)
MPTRFVYQHDTRGSMRWQPQCIIIFIILVTAWRHCSSSASRQEGGVGIRQLRVNRGSAHADGYKCGGWVVERVCVGCARRVMVAEEKTWDTAAEGVKVHLPS